MTAGTPGNARAAAGSAASPRWGFPDAVLVWVFHIVVSSLWAALLISAFYGDRPDPIPVRLLAASSLAIWAVYIGGPIIVTRIRGAGPVADLWARITWSDVPSGLAIGAALQWIVLPVIYWPLLRLTDVDPSTAAQDLVDTIDGSLDVVLFSVVVALGAPLAEEFFYRGMVLQGLRRHVPDVAAVLVSAAFFALVHIQPILFPGTFVLGVVAAIATLRTRRLGMAVAMHVGFNGATLLTLLAF